MLRSCTLFAIAAVLFAAVLLAGCSGKTPGPGTTPAASGPVISVETLFAMKIEELESLVGKRITIEGDSFSQPGVMADHVGESVSIGIGSSKNIDSQKTRPVSLTGNFQLQSWDKTSYKFKGFQMDVMPNNSLRIPWKQGQKYRFSGIIAPLHKMKKNDWREPQKDTPELSVSVILEDAELLP